MADSYRSFHQWVLYDDDSPWSIYIPNTLYSKVNCNFLILYRVLIALGILCSQNSPLLADYIQKPSQGLANSYVSLIHFLIPYKSNIVITFSIILSTTGMIQLNQAFNGEYLALIFVFIGSILVAIGVICIFGVVDLNTGKK